MHEVGVDPHERTAHSMPKLVPHAAVRGAEIDPRNGWCDTRRSCAGGERNRGYPVRGQVIQHGAFVTSDTTGNPLQQLAGVERDSHDASASVEYAASRPRAVSSHENARTRSWPRAMSAVRVVSSATSAIERVGQPDLVGRFDEQRGVAGDLRDRTGARGHDRHANRHRFEQRKSEAFVDRRVREYRGPFEQRRGVRRR